MTFDRYHELFDELYDEVSDRYYQMDDELNSEAHLITFHLGQLLKCVENNLFLEWVIDGCYYAAEQTLRPALAKGSEEGIPQLEHVIKLFNDTNRELGLPVYCDVCGGSGEVDYGMVVSGQGVESCADCLGSGMVGRRDGPTEAVSIDQIGNDFHQLDETQLKTAFGRLVLLYTPEDERDRLIKEFRLRRLFA